MLEKFVAFMYGAPKFCHNLTLARKHLFCTDNKPLHLCPPTTDALKMHTLRVAYQAGQIWGRMLYIPTNVIPDPSKWGWQFIQQKWCPIWMTLPEIWEACRELDTCGCKKGCDTLRCICRKENLPCTLQCKSCKGECTNKR